MTRIWLQRSVKQSRPYLVQVWDEGFMIGEYNISKSKGRKSMDSDIELVTKYLKYRGYKVVMRNKIRVR